MTGRLCVLARLGWKLALDTRLLREDMADDDDVAEDWEDVDTEVCQLKQNLCTS